MGIHEKIKLRAVRVLEALSDEFKIFKDISAGSDQNLWRLIAYHSRIQRTYEVTKLTIEVSFFI